MDNSQITVVSAHQLPLVTFRRTGPFNLKQFQAGALAVTRSGRQVYRFDAIDEDVEFAFRLHAIEVVPWCVEGMDSELPTGSDSFTLDGQFYDKPESDDDLAWMIEQVTA